MIIKQVKKIHFLLFHWGSSPNNHLATTYKCTKSLSELRSDPVATPWHTQHPSKKTVSFAFASITFILFSECKGVVIHLKKFQSIQWRGLFRELSTQYIRELLRFCRAYISMLNINHLLKPSNPLIKAIQPAVPHQGVCVLCEVVTDITWWRKSETKFIFFGGLIWGQFCTWFCFSVDCRPKQTSQRHPVEWWRS